MVLHLRELSDNNDSGSRPRSTTGIFPQTVNVWRSFHQSSSQCSLFQSAGTHPLRTFTIKAILLSGTGELEVELA